MNLLVTGAAGFIGAAYVLAETRRCARSRRRHGNWARVPPFYE